MFKFDDFKEFKNFETHIRFLNNPILARLINTIGGFFVANKPIIEFVDNTFNNEEIKTLQEFFINSAKCSGGEATINRSSVGSKGPAFFSGWKN